jgi:PHD/YefM family antitoxin component YafN of YafNO toxin-antitoxin module
VGSDKIRDALKDLLKTGVDDAKDAVDAWRLVQLSELVGICDTTFESWQETLNELSNLRQLEKHKVRKHHFVLTRTPQ